MSSCTNDHFAHSLIVLDFETTGLSPTQGERAIEIGAVKLEDGVATERFQALMNPGRRVSDFIENYTGISNEMLNQAAPCEQVMSDFADFIGDSNLLAHNASFDSRFLTAELERIGRRVPGKFACSLLVARRIYQQAPNHKLASLINYKKIPSSGGYHRALFDAEMTAKLWLVMLADINSRYGIDPVPFNLIEKLSKTSKQGIDKLLKSY